VNSIFELLRPKPAIRATAETVFSGVRGSNFLDPLDATDGKHQLKPDYAARQNGDRLPPHDADLHNKMHYILLSNFKGLYSPRDTTKMVVSVMRTVKAAPSPSGSIIAAEIVRLKKVRSAYGTSQRRNPTLRRTERT
jgi:hypothetical protein